MPHLVAFISYHIPYCTVLCGIVPLHVPLSLPAPSPIPVLLLKLYVPDRTLQFAIYRHAMFGIIALWPFITLVWLMAVFVYLVPQRYQVFDFLFELLNSLQVLFHVILPCGLIFIFFQSFCFQGLLILLFLGVVIPSFRKGMFCKYKPEDVSCSKKCSCCKLI